ncbi:hypothetical protein BH18ACT4_BH18ACT4_01460 [soil metagenome]
MANVDIDAGGGSFVRQQVVLRRLTTLATGPPDDGGR